MEEPARFVLSKQIVHKQYEEIRRVCDVVSYSTKTNYEVARILEEETDCCFSIHSVEGVAGIKDCSRIWFFAQGWDEGEIVSLLKRGITGFVVDNDADLAVLLRVIERRDERIRLLLRLRLKEHTIHTGKYFVYGFYSERANELVSELRENKKIEKIGIHFHRKTQNISEWDLEYELKAVLSDETIGNIDYVNIGGGFPIRYRNFQADLIEGVFREVSKLRA
jgi:ornithine decarboxylase